MQVFLYLVLVRNTTYVFDQIFTSFTLSVQRETGGDRPTLIDGGFGFYIDLYREMWVMLALSLDNYSLVLKDWQRWLHENEWIDPFSPVDIWDNSVIQSLFLWFTMFDSIFFFLGKVTTDKMAIFL